MKLTDKHDVFGFWKIADYDWAKDRQNGLLSEIPFVHSCNHVPGELVLFGNHRKASCLKNAHKKAIHFFQHDYLFNPTINSKKKLTAQLDVFRKYECIILPDCSVYRNMPLPVQQYQVYNSRATGVFLEHEGISIIPSVRWGDESSYSFCFDGLEKNSVLAVGTLGTLKDQDDKKIFIAGFLKMIEQLNPIGILIYGSLPDGLRQECVQKNIFIKEYPTEWNNSDKNNYINNFGLSSFLFDT
jgi:glycosyltransferase involved in cell wall biosynthesis